MVHRLQVVMAEKSLNCSLAVFSFVCHLVLCPLQISICSLLPHPYPTLHSLSFFSSFSLASGLRRGLNLAATHPLQSTFIALDIRVSHMHFHVKHLVCVCVCAACVNRWVMWWGVRWKREEEKGGGSGGGYGRPWVSWGIWLGWP